LGSSATVLVWDLDRAVEQDETGTYAYTNPGNGIEDLAGNDLANVTDGAIDNQSTVGADETVLLDDNLAVQGTWVLGSAASIVDGEIVIDRDLEAGGGAYAYHALATSSKVRVRFKARIESAVTTTYTIASLNYESGTLMAQLQMASGKLRILTPGPTGNVFNVSTENVPTGTDVWFFLEYQAGDGTNAVAAAGFSETSDMPELVASGATTVKRVDGVSTDSVTRLQLGNLSTVQLKIAFDDPYAVALP